MRKSTIIKIILAVITFCILVTSIFFISRYNNAAKTAENTVAVYLAKHYNRTQSFSISSDGGFNSFNKVYNTTKVKKLNCIVELGGNVSSGYGKGTYTLYSKVKINLFTNTVKIETIKISGEEKLK